MHTARSATTTKKGKSAGVAIRYPETDDMAENTLQRLIAEFLRPLIQRFLREATEGSLATKKRYRPLRAAAPCFVGADQFWYYVERNPKKCVSPDVYVIAGADPLSAPPSWFLWTLDTPPLFALEIVSVDVGKDYKDARQLYEHTHVQELVIFDPEAPRMAEASRGQTRVRWRVFRRNGAGELVLAHQSNADRVQSEALCCWLRLVGEGNQRLLRIGVGVGGEQLFLTAEEFERTEKERALAEKERALAEKDRERVEKERALMEKAHEHSQRVASEAKVRELELELARTKPRPTSSKPRSR